MRIVLVPGLGCDTEVWSAQIDALSRHHPQAAQAGGPPEVHVTDVATRHASIAAMAGALLDEHPGELVLCGASMGGMIAMEAARQAPQRVRGLALLGTTARPESAQMRQLREDALVLFAQGRVREVLEPNVGFAFDAENARNRALVGQYMAMVLRAGADQLIAQNRAVIGRPDARIHLPQLRCPVLVLCGEADALTPPEHAREIAALVPGSRLAILPGCGHMLTMEQPEAVNEALLDWLRKLQAAR